MGFWTYEKPKNLHVWSLTFPDNHCLVCGMKDPWAGPNGTVPCTDTLHDDPEYVMLCPCEGRKRVLNTALVIPPCPGVKNG